MPPWVCDALQEDQDPEKSSYIHSGQSTNPTIVSIVKPSTLDAVLQTTEQLLSGSPQNQSLFREFGVERLLLRMLVVGGESCRVVVFRILSSLLMSDGGWVGGAGVGGRAPTIEAHFISKLISLLYEVGLQLTTLST